MRHALQLTGGAALALLLCVLLAACVALPDPAARRLNADLLAAGRGWQPLDLPAGPFLLRAYASSERAVGTLTIYIEGDGLAWVTASLPSDDPTPGDPLALRLALAQPAGAAAYLARPCQYVHSPACSVRDWTDGRFSAKVVAASSRAVDQLKARAGAERIVLVGYSGGGAIAALVAAGRDDVERLITVAGNLDHVVWTRLHRVTPLSASLNAADVAATLAPVPQWHWVGDRDDVLPERVVRAFLERPGGGTARRLQVMPEFDHRCCWVEHWPDLWQQMRGVPLEPLR